MTGTVPSRGRTQGEDQTVEASQTLDENHAMEEPNSEKQQDTAPNGEMAGKAVKPVASRRRRTRKSGKSGSVATTTKDGESKSVSRPLTRVAKRRAEAAQATNAGTNELTSVAEEMATPCKEPDEARRPLSEVVEPLSVGDVAATTRGAIPRTTTVSTTPSTTTKPRTAWTCYVGVVGERV
ncbi:hypothetical protein F441_11706 [Phytophthora nicotianae CJ01A1]|uniref:Uncharacterized protein n=2 Tax=Phytophthora nicotianae TaxID=4792 RepID=W2GLW0_PHYNI|nr:hypothetical protein L915_11452 [Phytophthora nicotianae]ETL36705.1 hypothetical protein L916_11365 [Phytophthora nicotianae]ETP13021.1 hypothetical protein F441_11706 [Phytophthora nicotianae CJ01A1]